MKSLDPREMEKHLGRNRGGINRDLQICICVHTDYQNKQRRQDGSYIAQTKGATRRQHSKGLSGCHNLAFSKSRIETVHWPRLKQGVEAAMTSMTLGSTSLKSFVENPRKQQVEEGDHKAESNENL